MTAARLSVEIPRDYWLTANRTVVNHGYRRRIIADRDLSATYEARARRLLDLASKGRAA